VKEGLALTLAKVQELDGNGIPCRAITVWVTDGEDTTRERPEIVAPLVHDMVKTETHIVAAYGIAQDKKPNGDPDEDMFRDVFAKMGVLPEWVLTSDSDPSSIRRKFGVLSQSVSGLAQGVAAGGFGTP
jgi:hypothetical protein